MRRSSKSSGESTGGGAGATVTGLVTFLVGAAIVTYLFLTNGDYKPKETYWFINTGLCLWAPLMAIMFFLRHEPGEYGLQRGDAREGFRWALLFWIAMVFVGAGASSRPEFRHYYLNNMLTAPLWGFGPVFNGLSVRPQALLYYELAMGFYMFCWEFFFRGFLLFGFAKTKLGAVGAIILQTIPFVLLHWSWNVHASKPSLEVIGSAIAAPILGILALRTRSIVWGFLAHWAVSMTFDLFILAPFIFRHVG
jgi:membrane protease YdiL (CAAX protease family)